MRVFQFGCLVDNSQSYYCQHGMLQKYIALVQMAY